MVEVVHLLKGIKCQFYVLFFEGNESLRCASSPLLKKMMIEVHKEVGDPFDKGMTVFDRSKSTQPDKNYPDEHRIGSLGSGSDYTAFYQFLGVPSLDVSYQQVITVSTRIFRWYLLHQGGII